MYACKLFFRLPGGGIGGTMDLGGYKMLSFASDGPVLTVFLDRPEIKNAANAALELELCRVFADASTAPEVRAVILTGRGEVFSAGGDFAYIREVMEHQDRFWDAMVVSKRLIATLLDCTKPVIAKINGPAIGFGATLALFCDVTFAANHARIGDPHVALGFTAGDGGAVIWPQLVGFHRAKEYLFTGEALLAPEAERIGLINRAVPAGDLDRVVSEYAHKVAAMPARAVQWTKAAINLGLKQLAHAGMDTSLAYEALSNATRDHREAMNAIAEKRPPKFIGN
jgi:enoyl-CoA hydratase